MTKPMNVLFLCTHNSARSILAEALLNHLGRKDGVQRFRGFSAGSSPRENQQPNSLALRALQDAGIDTQGLSSKSWDVFAQPDAPRMDLVITVCDNAAGEVCPVWPGQPMTAHWGIEDPAVAEGDEAAKRHAVSMAFRLLNRRIALFASLPIGKLDALSLQNELNTIGDLRKTGE